MGNKPLKRIIFAGGGSPLLKVIKLVLQKTHYKNIEVAAIFVPEGEIEYFSQSLPGDSSFPIEKISRIERGRFEDHEALNECDYLISFNNMSLIDDKVIKYLRYGGINYHAGSLPEYAGSYTYQWAIRNNEMRFASSMHWIKGKADSGPIICKRDFPLSSNETGLSILMKCTNAAIDMMTELFHYIDSDKALPSISQDLSKRKFYSLSDIRNSGLIDWNSSADEIGRLVRAADFSPLPSPTYVPYTETKIGTMKVLKTLLGNPQNSSRAGVVIVVDHRGIEVATGCDKSIILTSIILDGKKFIPSNILDSGIKVGDCLGSTL